MRISRKRNPGDHTAQRRPHPCIVWQVLIGRVPLFLLDTNILENPAGASRGHGTAVRRRVQDRLPGGAAGSAGCAPPGAGDKTKVVHMNEGHCAFAGLERLAQSSKSKNRLKAALEITPRTTCVTTHTPVAAGHDEFPADAVRPYLKPLADRLDTTEQELLSLGQAHGANDNARCRCSFSAFAWRPTATASVSSRQCRPAHVAHHLAGAHRWKKSRLPHHQRCAHRHLVSQEFANLFDRYLGTDWYGSQRPDNINASTRFITKRCGGPMN